MINYLCLLGWNDGTDQDIYTREQLVDAFSLARVTKSPAVFDMKKLRWVNGQHLRALPEETFQGLIAEQFRESGLTSADAPAERAQAFTGAVARMAAEKVELVNDAEALTRAALDYPLRQTLEADPSLANGLSEVRAPPLAAPPPRRLPASAASSASSSSAITATACRSPPLPSPTLRASLLGQVAATIVAMHKAGELPDLSSADFGASWKAWSKALGQARSRQRPRAWHRLPMLTTPPHATPATRCSAARARVSSCRCASR